MKIYHVTLSIAVADDYPEQELIDRIKETAAEMEGDPQEGDSARRIAAKATLTYGQMSGGDPDDHTAWHRQAAESIMKTAPDDWFVDQREQKAAPPISSTQQG